MTRSEDRDLSLTGEIPEIEAEIDGLRAAVYGSHRANGERQEIHDLFLTTERRLIAMLAAWLVRDWSGGRRFGLG